MKQRVKTIVLTGALATSVLSGCHNNKTYSVAGQTIYGEIENIQDQTLTLELGSYEGNTWNLTQTTQTIELNDSVSYSQQGFSNSMGQPGQMPQGQQDMGAQNQQEPPAQPPQMNSETQDPNNSQEESAQQPSNEQSVPDSEGSGNQGDTQEQTPPQMPQMNGQQQSETIEKDDIQKGDIVSVTFDKNEKVTKVTVLTEQQAQQGSNSSVSYSAVKEIKSDEALEKETITSTQQDENAVLVSGNANVTLNEMTIQRNSDAQSSAENASFYGTSAAVLGTKGKLYVKDSQITTDAQGGAGVFSYGDGEVYVANTKIQTTQGASGGIHVAGGGTLYAWDLQVETQGQSSAAIRSDRGGGTLVVDQGTYTSNGVGSPAIYSTADISVHDAALRATGSEAICIEGKNSVSLYDTDLSGNMADDEQNDVTWNVILYQSMSGDSEEGNAVFNMDQGTLTAQNGGMFYTTNTESTFTLHDVDIQYAQENDFFLRCTGNANQRGWGQAGQNGADCTFTAIEQEMQGNIIWDSISTLDLYMTENSHWTGAFIKDDTYANQGSGGSAKLVIEKGSTWTVTENSIVTELCNEGDIVDAQGKTVTIQSEQGEVFVKGDSEITITVESYSEKADLSEANSIPSWKSVQQEKPQELNEK